MASPFERTLCNREGPDAAVRLAGLAVAIAVGGASAGCAATDECRFNSDCERPGRCENGICVRNCIRDRDCPDGWCDDLGYCQTGTPDADADGDGDADAPADESGTEDADVPVDESGTEDADAHRDELGADGADADGDDGTTRPGIYLDECGGPADCADGLCVDDPFWGEGYCSRECTVGATTDCASEHVCAAASGTTGACLEAHMGLPCDPTASTGNACGAWCVGIAGGAAHCTRECGSAADCPGGFACSRTTGGEDVCVQVNIACPSTANQCPSGIGACGGGPGSGTWCTARCRSAADCPRLGEGVPPYVCEVDPGLGFSVCQITPEMDPYVGERGLGESCSPGVTGCRSGLCADDGTGSAPYCIERCTARGGCPHGFGCAPYRTGAGSAYSLFCVVAGSGNAGDPCEDNRDCRSGYCDTDACTRICNDGFCPSGMTCASSGITADGAAIRVCR